MSDKRGVQPREGGPYSLYCYDCGEWVPNTANHEMAKEGCFSHSHWCKPRKARERGGGGKKIDKIKGKYRLICDICGEAAEEVFSTLLRAGDVCVGGAV